MKMLKENKKNLLACFSIPLMTHALVFCFAFCLIVINKSQEDCISAIWSGLIFKEFESSGRSNIIIKGRLPISSWRALYTLWIFPVMLTLLFFKLGMFGSWASGNMIWQLVYCMMALRLEWFLPMTIWWWWGEISIDIWTGVWFWKQKSTIILFIDNTNMVFIITKIIEN